MIRRWRVLCVARQRHYQRGAGDLVLDGDGRPMIENSPMLTVELSRRPDGARTLAIGASPHPVVFQEDAR